MNLITKTQQAINEGQVSLPRQVGINSFIFGWIPFLSYCNASIVGISPKTAAIYTLASSVATTASIKIWEAVESQLYGSSSQYPFFTDPGLESAKYACQGVQYYREGQFEIGSYHDNLKILAGIAVGIMAGKKIAEKTGNPLSYKQIAHLTGILMVEWAGIIEITKK